MLYLKLLLVGAFLSTNVVAKNKIITSDIALYRVQDEVVFLSSYKAFKKGLRIFRCFNKNVLFLPALGLDKESLKTLPSVKQIKTFDDDSKRFIKKVILLKKALIHIKKQKRKYDKRFFTYFEKHKCLNRPYRSWSKTIQNMVTVELYFQERFKKGTKLKIYDPKVWENVKFYLLSLDKKINHDVFF
ncbi:MAG: hypothetical protein DRQ88_09675 [Epsilonproteobacteria bacterium]|nr:MAG: hypothetical protein DRQ89_02715 [Campylobacterota bacterium]RLA65196.1 MAG: hypothetical protein DRQ88_09675 [Campylobacterota bacterium]